MSSTGSLGADVSEQTYVADDEISLLDIYNFLKEGWKTLCATTVAGAVLGIGTAFVLPEKYLATAAIEPARVLGNHVESINVLAEKMRSPTYYSSNTFNVCGLSDKLNPAQIVTTELKPNVARQSAYVSISYKADSPQSASACLAAVLEDVNRNQNEIAAPQIELANARIRKEEEKLKLAEDFVAAVADKRTSFNFSDSQFSASSLLIATLQSKQNEITELKNSIQSAKLALTEPQTKAASFATPVYAPPIKAEPKRSRIAVISVLAGAFVGLLFLFVRRAVKHIKEQTIEPSRLFRKDARLLP